MQAVPPSNYDLRHFHLGWATNYGTDMERDYQQRPSSLLSVATPLDIWSASLDGVETGAAVCSWISMATMAWSTLGAVVWSRHRALEMKVFLPVINGYACTRKTNEMLYPSVSTTKMTPTLFVQAWKMGQFTTAKYASCYSLLVGLTPPILQGLTFSGSSNKEHPTELELTTTRGAPGCAFGHRSTLYYR